MSRSTNKSVLITGGAKRIGASIAMDFAERGYHVIIHYHQSADMALSLISEIRKTGGKSTAIAADLSIPSQLDDLWNNSQKEAGSIDVLINNAALFVRDHITALDADLWDRHMRINCFAPIRLMQKMAEQSRDGLNTVNIVDHSIFKLPSGYASYTLSKSALWAATQIAAKNYLGQMRVNAVAPGLILPADQDRTDQDWRCDYAPAAMPYDENIADILQTIRHVIHNPSLTGQLFPVDSGRHITPHSIRKTVS